MQLNTSCLYGLWKGSTMILSDLDLPLGKRPSFLCRLGELRLAALHVCFFNWLSSVAPSLSSGRVLNPIGDHDLRTN